MREAQPRRRQDQDAARQALPAFARGHGLFFVEALALLQEPPPLQRAVLGRPLQGAAGGDDDAVNDVSASQFLQRHNRADYSLLACVGYEPRAAQGKGP